MAVWPLGKPEGTGITMRLETILSQVPSSEGEGAETIRLWAIGTLRSSDGLR